MAEQYAVIVSDGEFRHRLIYEDGHWYGAENVSPLLLSRISRSRSGQFSVAFHDEIRNYTWEPDHD